MANKQSRNNQKNDKGVYMEYKLKITNAENESLFESFKSEEYYFNIGEIIRTAYLRGDLKIIKLKGKKDR